MLRHLLCRPVQLHPAGVQEVAIVAAFQRKLDILLHEQDRHAGFRQIENDAEDLVHDLRGKTKRRLVQHQELRLGHQRAPDRQHLLLSAGHAARHAVAAFPKNREKLEDLRTQRLEALAGTADMCGNEIFLDSQALKYLPSFGAMRQSKTHDLLRPGAGDIAPFEMDRSGGRACHARNGVQERGLAGTVRAEDDDDLAGVDLEIDVFKNADAPVSRAEPGDPEQRL